MEQTFHSFIICCWNKSAREQIQMKFKYLNLKTIFKPIEFSFPLLSSISSHDLQRGKKEVKNVKTEQEKNFRAWKKKSTIWVGNFFSCETCLLNLLCWIDIHTRRCVEWSDWTRKKFIYSTFQPILFVNPGRGDDLFQFEIHAYNIICGHESKPRRVVKKTWLWKGI